MNFLAHILLAPDTEARVGALLGDFVKATTEAEFGPVIHREILLHRKIDGFTDSHPAVRAAKALFRRETRRFAGILLDVFYDHLLARDWARYCARPLPDFVREFYRDAERYRARFPPPFARAFDSMVADDWLQSYRTFAGVQETVQRIGMRRPKFVAPLGEGLADLHDHDAMIAADFGKFFAELSCYTEQCRASCSTAGRS